MNCLLDSDFIKKLALCDLLTEGLAALQTTAAEAYVLPTARYVLLKPFKKPEQARQRLGDAAFDRLSQFLAAVQVLSGEPSEAALRLFDDIVGIDSGEAILFSVAESFDDFLLATSDKKSLRALQSTPACEAVCNRLSGKVVCFEQIVMRVIDDIGVDAARAKIVPAANCDTALRAAFGSGLEATEANVRSSLAAYVAELRETTGGLLVLD